MDKIVEILVEGAGRFWSESKGNPTVGVDYCTFTKIEQINESVFAGYIGNRIAKTWNYNYVIEITYGE